MMEMFMFAIILTAVQVVAGLAMVRFCMTDFVVKRYVKFAKKTMDKLVQMEFEDED